jgi:hypothetical protein
MTARRFWVIGGEYADIAFQTFTSQTPTVAGPFTSEDEAKDVWRNLSAKASNLALTRFSIVHEQVRLAV